MGRPKRSHRRNQQVAADRTARRDAERPERERVVRAEARADDDLVRSAVCDQRFLCVEDRFRRRRLRFSIVDQPFSSADPLVSALGLHIEF
jgi:hypothetical protein